MVIGMYFKNLLQSFSFKQNPVYITSLLPTLPLWSQGYPLQERRLELLDQESKDKGKVR